LLFVVCLLVSAAEAARRTKILVLHSYHQGLEWTDNITRGIQSVFAPLDSEYEIHFQYLDTKRNPGQKYRDSLVDFLGGRIADIPFAALIVSDNNGLEFVKKVKNRLRPDLPVVFCGINNFSEQLVADLEHVAGVREIPGYRETVELMLQLHPERRQVLIVNDRTPTGLAIETELRGFLDTYRERADFEFYSDFLLSELPARLRALDRTWLVYLAACNQDRAGEFISYAEGVRLVSSAAPVPVYGPWDFYVGKGIVGGKVTSGFSQGKLAAELALDILQGRLASDARVFLDCNNRYLFDHTVLTRFGIDESRLPADRTVLNLPEPWLRRNNQLVIGSGVVLVLVVLVQGGVLVIRRRRERRLEQSNLELDRRVAEKTARLQVMNATKNKLFSIIGHDLGGTVGNIGLSLETLLAGDLEGQDARELMLAMERSNRHLRDLLHNLLAWSRSLNESVQIECEPFDILPVIEECCEVLDVNAAQKSIRLTNDLEQPLLVVADRNMILTVVRNLLSNAVKFTEHGGSVTIDARGGGDMVAVTVRDTGIGIDAADQRELFTEGRFHSTWGTANEKGSGLGLVLCADFATGNGGELTVESEVGRGSTFTFTVPAFLG